MATTKTWKTLSAEDEKGLARRIVDAEQRARTAIEDLDCVQHLLRKKAKGSERTRAGRIDRLGEAIELVWRESRTDPSLKESARVARAAWHEAETTRWELAMSGRRIAHGEARKLQGSYMDEADLTQEGYVGLLRAAKRFDPDRDIRFGTYARWWVRAQMTRAIDMHGRMVRLPGCAVEQLRNMRKVMAEYDRAGEDWTVHELAEQTGIETDRAEFLLSRGRAISLEEPVDDGPKSRPVGAFLADDEVDDPEESAEHAQELGRVLEAVNRVLDERQRFVVVRRFGLEDGEFRSLSEIARGMSLSRERVRQIERDALQTLKRVGGIREPHAA